MADKLSGSRVAGEVAPVARFTPLPFWVPMPSLDVQFRILTICDHLPASRENLLNHPFGKDFVGGGERNAVNAGAEGFRGTDRKSTRLNSSHITISYAVFCLKKKK